VWDVVTGEYGKPTEASEKAPSSEGIMAKRAIRMWNDADPVALLTIERNCEEDIQARNGNCSTASEVVWLAQAALSVEPSEAYQELQKAYKGKTTTEYGALVDSFVSMSYDNRKGSIDEYIASYKQIWNTFAGIISRVNLTDDDGFGEGLKNFAKSDSAKTEILLRSFLPFYPNTIENIKSKEPTDDDTIRKLCEYIPMR